MPNIIKYPLDPTGISITNLVQGEVHTLVNRPIRCVATMYGGYYANSMVITDLNTNVILNANQWYPGELYDVPTALYGLPVYALVVISDTSVSNNISLQYQVVGGEFSTSETALINLINTLNVDNRPVDWPNIILKPSEYPPSEHLHNAGDIYGFEYVVHAIERVKSAIEYGSAVYQDKLYEYVDTAVLKPKNIIETNLTIATDCMIYPNTSAISTGAITIDNDVLVNIEDGSTWSVDVLKDNDVDNLENIIETNSTISIDHLISAGNNAVTIGTVTIDDGVTINVPNGSLWSIDDIKSDEISKENIIENNSIIYTDCSVMAGNTALSTGPVMIDNDVIINIQNGSTWSIDITSPIEISKENIIESNSVISTDYIITTGSDALSIGPILMENDVTVVIPNGSTWAVDLMSSGSDINTELTNSTDTSFTIDFNNQVGTNYTITLSDVAFSNNPGKVLTFNNAATQTVTIPPNSSVACPIGATIQAVQLGMGKVTFIGGSGVTINSAGGLKSIATQYGAVTLMQTAIDVWVLIGTLIA